MTEVTREDMIQAAFVTAVFSDLNSEFITKEVAPLRINARYSGAENLREAFRHLFYAIINLRSSRDYYREQLKQEQNLNAKLRHKNRDLKHRLSQSQNELYRLRKENERRG